MGRPDELVELVKGSKAIFSALGGHKTILPEEQPVMEFAFASVVSTKDIKKGSILNVDNIWVKKPGTGEISSEKLNSIIGKTAREDIKKGQQLTWMMIND